MNGRDSVAAIYLVGNSSLSQPRLIGLQHQRILSYRSAVAGRYELGCSAPRVFVHLALPRFASRVRLIETSQVMERWDSNPPAI